MDDQIQQIGTILTEDYHLFLDNCLEGTLNALQLPEEITPLSQLDQDFEAFAELEYQFKMLESKFNSGFGQISIIQEAPKNVAEAVETIVPFTPDYAQRAEKTPMPKGVSESSKKEDKAHPGFVNEPRVENLDDANPTSTFFPNKPVQIDYPNQDKPTINPLDNTIDKGQVQPFTPKQEPLLQNIKKENQLPSGHTQQEEKTGKAKPLGSLQDFAQHFAPNPQMESRSDDNLSPTTDPEKSVVNQPKVVQKAYNPSPKNLKSFADFIGQQQESILPHPTTHEPPATSHQPPATSYQLPPTNHAPPPTAAAPKPGKINQKKTHLTDQEEITAFKADLVSNPVFVKQFLSTDNKPIPPELDYDELIENLANHLYWEYKRYYGK